MGGQAGARASVRGECREDRLYHLRVTHCNCVNRQGGTLCCEGWAGNLLPHHPSPARLSPSPPCPPFLPARDPRAKDYNAAQDPTKFKSSVSGRGPLTTPKWWEGGSAPRPLMCAYKLVRAEFRYFGLQSTVEGTVTSSQVRRLGRE